MCVWGGGGGYINFFIYIVQWHLLRKDDKAESQLGMICNSDIY